MDVMCKAAYDLARSFIEWKDMANKAEINDPVETQDAWMRLAMAEELFRRQLDGPDGRPCEDCPDPVERPMAMPNDVRHIDAREDT